MNLFELIVEPKSPFGTPLKGDTLFGQLCWKIEQNQNLLGKLEELLKDYDTRPFVILSSAFLRNENSYIMKIPALPLSLLFPQYQDRKKKKELKKKKWLVVPNDFRVSVKEENLIGSRTLFEKKIYVNGKEKLKCTEVILSDTQFHNTINRLWGTTGEGEFAPYSAKQEYYLPELEWAIFVGIDESLDSQKVRDGLEQKLRVR